MLSCADLKAILRNIAAFFTPMGLLPASLLRLCLIVQFTCIAVGCVFRAFLHDGVGPSQNC